MAGLGEYIINAIQRMDCILSSLDKVNRTDQEIYFWHYTKIEDFLRNSCHYDFVNFLDSEENDDVDEYHDIKYYDKKNRNSYVIFRFDKKSKKAYIYRKNKRMEKHEIPLITDYVTIMLTPYKIYVANYFHAFSKPKEEEFILTVFPHYKFLPDYDIRDLLTADKPFKNALKRTKESFDRWYDRITSSLNFSF